MIKPYMAVGLIPTVRGIRKRRDIKINLEHLGHLVKAAAWLSSLSIPVRLIAFPEGALQAFNDEVLDLDHATFARECAIDIPGEETEALGKIAREYNVFIIAQAKARHPDWKDRFFNVGFILNPRGRVILQHYKVSPLFPVEHSVCPHDVYDWWVEKYGRTLQAFWPVVDTEIGRLGIMMANEGSYPENARALALNGAEVVYRASYPHPATGNEYFEIQSRARALDNNMYVIAPNMGTYYLFPEETTPIDTFGGRSFIIDYKGRIVGRQDYGAGLDLRRRAGRHRGPPAPPGVRAVGQLAQGRPDRALWHALREADLPEEPLPQARAHEARRVPSEGDQAPDPAHARPRRVEEAERVMRPGLRRPARGRLRSVVAVVAATAIAVGCGAFRRSLPDVPPGHRLVLGEIFIAGFSEPRVVLDIVREDGTIRHELAVDLTLSPFIIVLPPGRYQVTRLRINESGRSFPEEAFFPVGATFDVGDAAAVYVGQLQIERVVFARQLRVTVLDDYERAVPEFRARYPELPSTIARAPMRAT